MSLIQFGPSVTSATSYDVLTIETKFVGDLPVRKHSDVRFEFKLSDDAYIFVFYKTSTQSESSKWMRDPNDFVFREKNTWHEWSGYRGLRFFPPYGQEVICLCACTKTVVPSGVPHKGYNERMTIERLAECVVSDIFRTVETTGRLSDLSGAKFGFASITCSSEDLTSFDINQEIPSSGRVVVSFTKDDIPDITVPYDEKRGPYPTYREPDSPMNISLFHNGKHVATFHADHPKVQTFEPYLQLRGNDRKLKIGTDVSVEFLKE